MSVHYKFKSHLDHDTITFGGSSISVADLRKSIMHKKKIGKKRDFVLQITNAQTKEVYDNDKQLIAKNTSVIVARVPVAVSKKNWNKPDLPLPIDDDLGQIRYDRIVKNADLVNDNTSEEDKIKAMIIQSSSEYDPSEYVKTRRLPHVKRCTGIPRSFLVPVDGPEHRGALLTSSGDYVVPLIDHQAYKEVKKERPPFLPQEEPVAEPEAQIPEELFCRLCKDLLQDAVLIYCCSTSFCDECIRQVLLESDNHECPECHEVDVSPATLIPNRYLHRAVFNFKNQTGYTRVKKSFVKSEPVDDGSVSVKPSPDSTAESQAQIPEELFCRLCKDLLQDAVLICCCGNSFCDECIRQVLLESDNHECPECQEVDLSPDTLFPNRYLRKAVLNFKNQTGYTRVKKSFVKSEPVDAGNVSPQPSLDSNVESQPQQTESIAIQSDKPALVEDKLKIETHSPPAEQHEDFGMPSDVGETSQPTASPKPSLDEDTEDIRPGTPLLDEPPVDAVHPPLPIQTIGQEQYHQDRYDYHSGSKYSRNYRDDYRDNYKEESMTFSETPKPTSTIATITNIHKGRGLHKLWYRKNNEYHHAEDHQESHYDVEYETHVYAEETSCRHPDRYRTLSHPVPIPAAVPVPPIIPPAPQVYPPQPTPPGTSPVDTSHIAAEPPPPGVGPFPLAVSNDQSAFNNQCYEIEDSHKDVKKIDDKLEAFQRQLEKKREYSKDHSSHSRRRSSGPEVSRSSSRSRFYSSSESWSRSHSRRSSRSSRSRSRTPPSGRSRSRSYTPKNYRHPSHRSVFYTGRHSYTPPHFGASYQYGPAPANDIPVLRTEYPPHHVHPIHPVPQSLHSRPNERHYPVERQPRCPPHYSEIYPMYDVYPHQRYDREQRPPRYDKRQEYQKDYQRQHPEVIAHRIPGYIGDRPRDYKQRYRQPREPRKEIIRELREPCRPDRRRPESSSQSRNVRHYGRESMQIVEKSRRVEYVPRSRSRSYESIERHNSFKRKHIRQHGEHSEEPPRHKSSREHSQNEPGGSKSKRKYSPIKPPEKHTSESDHVKKQQRRDYHDDLEFAPDYEPYSDIEEKEKMKRSASPEVVRKKARVEKIITESSEKDSTDSDKQKHKKHKHKYNKKSHKSKRE